MNNFKGYHNQDANKHEEDERYTDPDNGAHFEFNDVCKRLVKCLQNRAQEKKIFTLTGNKEVLDPIYYADDPTFKSPNVSTLKNKRQSAVPI